MKKLQSLVRLDFLLSNNFKANCTFMLSLIAIYMFVINPSNMREICMYAILVSTVADLILMNYKGIPGVLFQRSRLYVGMAFFVITHILYIICFGSSLPLNALSLVDVVSTLICCICICFWTMSLTIFFSTKKSNIFRWAAIIYTFVINTAVFTIFLCNSIIGGKLVFAEIGIILFLISDILILTRETVCDNTLVRKLIWIFYPIGQLLIIFSI